MKIDWLLKNVYFCIGSFESSNFSFRVHERKLEKRDSRGWSYLEKLLSAWYVVVVVSKCKEDLVKNTCSLPPVEGGTKKNLPLAHI